MMFNEMEAMVNFLNSSEGNDTPAWQAAMRDLNALMEAMKPYQTQDEATKTYPTISQEEYERIDRLFDAAVTSTNIYSKEESNDIHDTVRIQLTKNLKKEFLSKAYIEYKNVRPDPNTSLHDAMEHFRYQNVELTNADLQRVGANMSSRIQMTIDLDGQPTKGVFTKHSSFRPEIQYTDLLDEMKLKYGAFSSFWDALDNRNFYEGGLTSVAPMLFCNSENAVVYDASDELRQNAMDNFSVVAYLHLYPDINAEFQKYRNDPDFFNALFDFSAQAEKLSTSIGVNSEFLGLEPGENIDNRNSAMSSVANLLGVGDLLAKSKQLAVKMPDNHYETGTFMEFAKGKDINRLPAIDEMRVATIEAYEGKEVKEQLANLQALDYICGNVDRHLGNMLYQFDPNTHKLTGIKGIDNDASFFRRQLGSTSNLGQLPSLNNLGFMDKKMADKILSLDEGMLGASLHGYGLNEVEIAAAWERVQNLQQAIQQAPLYDPEKGKDPNASLTLVNSEDWDKLSLNELRKGNNYFEKINSAQNLATHGEILTQKIKQESELNKRALKSMLRPDNTKDLLARAKSHKPFMGVSQRYSNVLQALENYQNTPAPDDLYSEGNDAKWQAALALKEAVDNYKREKVEIGHLDAKGNVLQNFSGKPMNRINDVNEIGQFADKLLEQRQKTLDANRELANATREQAKLDEFKSKSPEEQQAILAEKAAQEQQIQANFGDAINNAAEDKDLSMVVEYDKDDLEEDLSLDDLNASAN